MERPGVSSWFPFLVFAVLRSAAAQNEPVYTAVNGDINLKPDSPGPINNILWRQKGDLVVEWVNNELDYYGMFVGHTTLNTATGHLEIKNTDESFTGPYTVEINSQPQTKVYMVEFINNVTKPEVDVKPLACSPERETCTLVCLHYGTSALGPLTYSWRKDDGDWKQGGKEMPINNDVKTKGIKTFTCRVKNPISEAESDPHENPFYYPILDKPIWPTALYLALKVLVVMTFLGLSGYFMWRKREILRKLMCPRQDREKKVTYEGPCTVYVL